MVRSSLLALGLYGITAVASRFVEPNGITATLDSGIIVGKAISVPGSEVVVNQFLGIPFAEPPLRFSPPQAVAPWKGVYDATAYKPACIQDFAGNEAKRKQTIEWFSTPPPPAGESEDCLNLNVFAPAGSTGDPKAVLVWLFGGGFVFGAGSLPLYDGTSFAANQDVVVVTVNYRTNIFGFPGSPDVEPNLGFRDQRLALDWVQRNIRSLGGDPDKVTIFGESAGGVSVDVLVTAPPDPVPFRAAIMQSGQGSILTSSNPSALSWQVLAADVGCNVGQSLECLRSIPALTLKSKIEKAGLDFAPVHDGGATWADKPRRDRLASTTYSSSIARVPILIGSNAQEGKTFAYGLNNTEAYLRRIAGEDVTDAAIAYIINAYPLGPGLRTENDIISRIYTDFAFQCPAMAVANDSATVGIPTWRYFFNASFPNTEIFEGSGAYHSSEINSVYGTYPRKGATEAQIELSQVMQKAWADFAKHPTQGPGWDQLPKLAVFNSKPNGQKPIPVLESNAVDSKCALYKSILDGYR